MIYISKIIGHPFFCAGTPGQGDASGVAKKLSKNFKNKKSRRKQTEIKVQGIKQNAHSYSIDFSGRND
jgi:hypothetical protein